MEQGRGDNCLDRVEIVWTSWREVAIAQGLTMIGVMEGDGLGDGEEF